MVATALLSRTPDPDRAASGPPTKTNASGANMTKKPRGGRVHGSSTMPFLRRHASLLSNNSHEIITSPQRPQTAPAAAAVLTFKLGQNTASLKHRGACEYSNSYLGGGS